MGTFLQRVTKFYDQGISESIPLPLYIMGSFVNFGDLLVANFGAVNAATIVIKHLVEQDLHPIGKSRAILVKSASAAWIN